MSSSSITPCWALSATGDVSWVLTTMPSDTAMVHEATGLGWPCDLDQALPAGADRVEQRVVAEPRHLMPISSAARMTSVPLGTLISKPSMVTVTRSARSPDRTAAGVAGDRHRALTPAASSANSVDAAGSNGQPPCRSASMYSSRKNSSDDVIGLVAPSPRAQKAGRGCCPDVEQLLEVLLVSRRRSRGGAGSARAR
jgi:hypothetical protein